MWIDRQHERMANQLSGVIPPGGGGQSPSTLLYDSAGDVTSDSHTGNQYVYDAEGRICAFQTPNGLGGTIMMGYLYDAEGTRVAKGTITTMSCDPATNGFTMTGNNTGTYVLGQGGQELTQLSGSGAWQRTNVFGGGKQLATYDSMGLHFQIEDALGTRRMQTNADGQPETDIQSLPYGDALATATDQYAPATADDATPLHFTGKERDTESGLDYFGARYYGSSMGRMMSPDDFSKDTHVADPQSWNLYAYARNNPLRYTDPTGQTATESTSCSTDSSGHQTCNVSITASIAIYAQSGSGLTQAQLNSAASTIQGSIDSAWSGSFSQDGVSYNVSTNVSVSVFGSQDAASGSGAQNVIGISNGDAIPGQADSYVNSRSLGQAIFGGQDTGVWNYNNLGTGVAAHEFTHLLGVGDRTSGAILSNTNYLNDPSIPHTATANDLRWGVQEATQGANAHYSGGINTPVFSVPPSPQYSGQTTVGAAWHWWK